MTCAEVQAELSLYLYGELDFAKEDSIEAHFSECAFCLLALNREKEWHAAVNKQQRDVSPEWVAVCRMGLDQRIASEPTSSAQVRHRLTDWWRGFFDFRTTERSYRLAGISFFVLLGFAAGRFVNSSQLSFGSKSLVDSAGFLPPSVVQVQGIRPESGNRVRIFVQQVRVREVLGDRDDDRVRALLLGAARESDDPGVRMDSVEMLAGQNGVDIRNALIDAVKGDSNAAVRVKAIELLRQIPSDLEIREALEYALAHDSDAGVRTEAMDALVPAQGDFQITPQLLQTITSVVKSPSSDDYVRWRCSRILQEQAAFNGIH